MSHLKRFAIFPDPPPEEAKLLDGDQQGRVCALVSLGMSPQTSVELVGGDAVTLAHTAAADPQFALRLKKSAAEHEAGLLARIDKAAQSPRDWRAAVWLLERTRPNKYGRRRPRTITEEQFHKAMRTFARGLIDCVQDASARRRIVQYLKRQGLDADESGVPTGPAADATATALDTQSTRDAKSFGD